MGFAASPPPMPPTPLDKVDAAIEALSNKRTAWQEVTAAQRIELLQRCITGIVGVAERWAETGARIKGVEPNDNLAGEEWLAGIMPSIRNARLLAEALKNNGAPKPTLLRTRNQRMLARVFPSNAMERLMFSGFTADVWMEPGKPASQGAIYREARTAKLCLVLGGGNVSSIPVMDVLYKLFVENEVCLLKMNPVNEALGPLFQTALEPLRDYLAIIYGGAEVGAHAAQHPKVETLHITGSDRTYDAIVWGKGDKTNRINERPFSAELGCVTPVIIVPGPWSASDIRFQARHVASMVTQNASFNCNAAKVVVVAKDWLQREAFLEALHGELASTPPRKAYYPGAQSRYAAFLEHYPKARVVGASDSEAIPWTVIQNADSYAFSNEAFCGVVAEKTIDGDDFLSKAVKFANEECWGTLSCCVLVHPVTEASLGDALPQAIEDLRYGGIGINVWPGAIYGLVSPTWGAFPGHTPEDIQSGVGVVHNTWLFDHPERSVVRGPFRIRPTPAWFADHKNLLDLGRKLVAFEAAPSWGGLMAVATAAMKG